MRKAEEATGDPGEHIVNKATFCKIIGKSRPWIDELIRRGMPAEGAGQRGRSMKINAPAAIDWLIQQERARHQPPTDSAANDENLSGADADRMHTIEKMRLAKISRQQKIGVLCVTDDVEQVFAATAVAVRKNVDAIAGRVAATLANIDDPAEIRRILLDECRRSSDSAADALETFIADTKARAVDEIAAIESSMELGGN